jgi:hypothetical protein
VNRMCWTLARASLVGDVQALPVSKAKKTVSKVCTDGNYCALIISSWCYISAKMFRDVSEEGRGKERRRLGCARAGAI